MREKVLCENCNREFERDEPSLEYDELDPSGRRWNEKEEKICPECKEDTDDIF